MGMQTGDREVIHVVLICDQCEKKVEFDTQKTEVGPEEFGWLEFNNPTDEGSVTFHTKRCAVGYFRDVVDEAYADVKEPDQSVDTVDEA